jgi:hypothetical protein
VRSQIRWLLGDDLHALAWIGRNRVMNVLRTQNRRRRRQPALNDQNIALSVEEPADFLSLEGTGVQLVRPDERRFRPKRVDVGGLAIDINERNARVGGEFSHRDSRRGVDRIDDDRVDTVGDEVLDLAQLFGNVVFRVFDLHRQVRNRFAVVNHSVPQNGEEVVVELVH